MMTDALADSARLLHPAVDPAFPVKQPGLIERRVIGDAGGLPAPRCRREV
jgi:hypothetical protein